MHISNDKWLITSIRIFYKNISVLLDCISLSELCSATNSTIAIVPESFTSQHSIETLNLAGCNIRIHYMKQTENMKLKEYEITATLLPHNTLAYSCSYIVNSVHEYFAVTDSHLQISQHQASLKHEIFTVSYHSHTTLLPKNILQLQLHFSCRLTLYSSNNLSFTKISVSCNNGLPVRVPNLRCF